jgi:hypothetical protein
MKLLLENYNDYSFLTEEVNGQKQYFVEGICIQADICNKNGRIYPKKHISKNIEQYIKEQVEQNSSFGELGHDPKNPNINMERVSHKFLVLKESGPHDYYAKALIMDTPMGKIVKNFIDVDSKFGISLKALGTTTKTKPVIVNEDFMLRTPGDIVHNPSAPDAFLTALVEEHEWIWQNGILVEKQMEDLKNTVLNANSNELREKQDKAWNNFMNTLKNLK